MCAMEEQFDLTKQRRENINLCTEVEKYPCLYDFHDYDYCTPPVLHETWVKVGRALGFTGEESKKNWTALRSEYVRGTRNSERGAAAARFYHYLDQHMQFILPYIKERKKSSVSTESLKIQIAEETSEQDTLPDLQVLLADELEFYLN